MYNVYLNKVYFTEKKPNVKKLKIYIHLLFGQLEEKKIK